MTMKRIIMFRFLNLKRAIQQLFKAAHDEIVSEMTPYRKGEVGFGSYEIAGFQGATHWVAITANDWSEFDFNSKSDEKNYKTLEKVL